MRLVPTRDIQEPDLAYIEAPFFACSEVRRLLFSNAGTTRGIRLPASNAPGFGALNSKEKLLREIEEGSTCLIIQSGAAPFRSPLQWQPASEGGSWVVDQSLPPNVRFHLENAIARIEREKGRQAGRQQTSGLWDSFTKGFAQGWNESVDGIASAIDFAKNEWNISQAEGLAATQTSQALNDGYRNASGFAADLASNPSTLTETDYTAYWQPRVEKASQGVQKIMANAADWTANASANEKAEDVGRLIGGEAIPTIATVGEGVAVKAIGKIAKTLDRAMDAVDSGVINGDDVLKFDVVEVVPNTALPHGFSNADQFAQFGNDVRIGLSRLGYNDVEPILQGSAVTGKSFRTGQPFDAGRVSDFDVALAGPSLLNKAQDVGVGLRSAGTRTGPLSARDLRLLGLRNLSNQLSQQAGRDVNFMIYSNAATAMQRAPSVVLPGVRR